MSKGGIPVLGDFQSRVGGSARMKGVSDRHNGVQFPNQDLPTGPGCRIVGDTLKKDKHMEGTPRAVWDGQRILQIN